MKSVLSGTALALLLSLPAFAQECAPPKVVASVDLIPNATGLKQYVPLSIAGEREQLLLDTGAEQTEITPNVADDLKLEVKESATWTFVATGAASNKVVVTDVRLGQLAWKGVEISVLPPNDISPRADYVGLFGADFLAKYDLSLDFEHHKLELIDPNHCPSTPPDWPDKSIVAVPFKLVASHIELPVVLDGRTIMATLDTGASRAVILRPAAEREFALVMGGPDTPQSSGTLNNMPGATVYHHVFKELKIGDVTIKDQQFSIIPDLFNQAQSRAEAATAAAKAAAAQDAKPSSATPAAATAATTKAEPPKPEEYVLTDILLGMAVWKNLRVYIDYKDQKLYVAQ
jgi:predicted aspartyl protease